MKGVPLCDACGNPLDNRALRWPPHLEGDGKINVYSWRCTKCELAPAKEYWKKERAAVIRVVAALLL